MIVWSEKNERNERSERSERSERKENCMGSERRDKTYYPAVGPLALSALIRDHRRPD
tara:strand:- start:51 stop:221 length:171 start_codon:yes stop_codon:yes gene_type:complete